MLVARLLGKPVVFQKHGGPLPESFFPNSKVMNKLFRLALRLPSAIVVLGQEECQAYRRFLPGQHVVEIPNAIEAGSLMQRPLEAESTGALHLVYLGRLAENKGIFEAVEACANLVGQGHDLRFTLAGGGPDEKRLMERVRALGLEERVHFAGPLFGEEKDDLWRSADVFVFPTYHREGLPYALLEAMAAGAVPVTTRVGAIPDVMQEGVHGLFVPPRDVESLVMAIARLDQDRPLLLQMARNGRARALEHYSVARLVGDFEGLYASLGGKAV
jgi:glycosyltransferase involved in cell wall biosynthesis